MGLSRAVLVVASWSTISFYVIPVCAFTFWIVILCVDHFIWLWQRQGACLGGYVGMMGGVCACLVVYTI